MNIERFLNELKETYNYDDKLLNAIGKIIPAMIIYFGKKHTDLIMNAIKSCEIIKCSPYQNIKEVIISKQLEYKEYYKDLNSIYISNPSIIYYSIIDSYIIREVNRYIIISHVHNLDSFTGIAELIKEITTLVKSYKNEYIIKDKKIYKRNGFELSESIIENESTINLINQKNSGIEIGFNTYDTDKIVELSLGAPYTSIDNKSLRDVAVMLKERLSYQDLIIEAELTGEQNQFLLKYDKFNLDMFNKLSFLLDSISVIESHRKTSNKSTFSLSITNERLKYLQNEVLNYFIDYSELIISINKRLIESMSVTN